MPPRDLRLKMLSCAMAEEIPPDYDAIIEVELPTAPAEVPTGYRPGRL